MNTHWTAPTRLLHKHQYERQSRGGLCCDSCASLADDCDLRITAVCSFFLILLVVNLKMFSLMVFWQRPRWGSSGQLTSPASCSAQAGSSGASVFLFILFFYFQVLQSKRHPPHPPIYLHLALQIRFHMHQCLRVGPLTHLWLIFSDCSTWWWWPGGGSKPEG